MNDHFCINGSVKNAILPSALLCGEKMHSITVAIVDIGQDQQRQMPINDLLRHNGDQIELLVDLSSDGAQSTERRCTVRDDLSFVENAIARIRRLNPQIVLMNTGQTIQECCDLLLALQDQCPDTQALLVIDEDIEENDLIKALACGARGFVTEDLESLDFSKVVTAIDRGEAWVSRSMTAKLMHQIVAGARDFAEANVDSAG